MQQQLPQAPFFDTRNPDPGKTFLQQQAQDQPGIALIMLLLPPVRCRIFPASPIHIWCPNFSSRRSNQYVLPVASTPTTQEPGRAW